MSINNKIIAILCLIKHKINKKIFQLKNKNKIMTITRNQRNKK